MPSTKKIIFLDIDGVLCTDAYVQSLPADVPWRDAYGDVFDPKCIAALKRIIDETGADIVISSDWRHNGILAIQEMWAYRSLPGLVIDVTPYYFDLPRSKVDNLSFYADKAAEVQRWHEISHWVEQSKFRNFAKRSEGPFYTESLSLLIIDDMNMTGARGSGFGVIQTAHNVGLTEADADKAISYLNF